MSGGWVSTAGTTISNKVITGDVTFAGSNLTLRNVRVTGEAVFSGDNIVVEDSEFGSVALSGTANARFTRIDVFGKSGKDGILVVSDSGPATGVVIKDSWVHNPVVTSTGSYEGVIVRGVDGLSLQNVVVDLGAYAAGKNVALMLQNANGGNRNVTVTGSRLLGGSYVLSSSGALSVTSSVLGNARSGYLAAGSTALTAFTGNTTPTGAALTYSGGLIK
jgi:hypothetical protein